MKQKMRMIIDTAMVIILPLLMAYALIGEEAHEWLGTAMFLLFVFHHILNIGWFRSIFKGKYNARRILMLVVNLLLLIIMILQPVSGIMMSKHIYTFLKVNIETSLIRTIHVAAPYWGLVLMCIHLGFHIEGMIRKLHRSDQTKKDAATKYVRTALLAAIGLYGVYAVWKRQILSYMFLRIQFVFFDYSESVWRFLLDYICIMLLFVMIGYGMIKLAGKKR